MSFQALVNSSFSLNKISLPFKATWAAGIATKIQVFSLVVTDEKVNTHDIVQKRRPSASLSPSWCHL